MFRLICTLLTVLLLFLSVANHGFVKNSTAQKVTNEQDQVRIPKR